MKALKRAAILSLTMFALAVISVAAAAISIVPGRADVNGLQANAVGGPWNFSTNAATNSDFVVFGCPGNLGGTETGCADPSKTPTSAWFMRYDATPHTLYVFVLALGGNKIDTSEDSFIKLADNTKIIDKSFANFAWYNLSGGFADGWEASASTIPAQNPADNPTPLTCGNLSIRTETHAPSHNTSGSGPTAFDITLPCTPSAVTVSSLSAQAIDGAGNYAVLALAAAGLVVLGGLVVAFRKR